MALGCYGRCCSRYGSTQLVKWTCSFVIFGLFTTLMFGRSMIAVIQGTIGIIMSIETYRSVSRGQRWFLKWYALYNIVNTVVSLVVAGVVLGGLDVECSTALNRDACNDIGILYGIMLSLGASSVGIFAAANSSVAYLAMRDEGPSQSDRKVDL